MRYIPRFSEGAFDRFEVRDEDAVAVEIGLFFLREPEQ